MDQNLGRMPCSFRLVEPQTSLHPHGLIATRLRIGRSKLNDQCGNQSNDKDSHLAPRELVRWAKDLRIERILRPALVSVNAFHTGMSTPNRNAGNVRQASKDFVKWLKFRLSWSWQV